MASELQTLEASLPYIQAQAYLGVASFCIIVYDIVLTADVEINLVWPAPLSFVKSLFLLNRYGVPAVFVWIVYMLSGRASSSLDSTYCFAYFTTTLMLQVLSMGPVGSALVGMRVYALYGRDKRILALLSFLILLKCAVSWTCVLYMCLHARAIGAISFVPVINTCVLVDRQNWILIVFVFMIVFDVTVFVLIFRKTWAHVSRAKVKTSLLSSMFVDGLWFLAVMLIVELLNLIAFTWFPTTLFLVGVYVMWCTMVTMVSRICLNLRSTARPQDFSQLTAFRTVYQPGEANVHLSDFNSEESGAIGLANWKA